MEEKLERNENNVTETDLINKKIKAMSRIFDGLAIANLAVAVSYAVFLVANSSQIISNFVYNMFANIPVVGQLLHFSLKSLNIVNLAVIQKSLLNPLLLLEIFYYTFPLIVIQVVLYVLKRRVVQRENAYFSLVCIFIIIAALVIVKQFDLILIPTAQKDIITSRDLFSHIIFMAQFISVGYMVSLMSKIGRFNVNGINRHEFAHRVMKVGMITSIVLLLTIGTGLSLINSQTGAVKKQVEVNYVLDLKPAADGTVNIIIPKELVSTTEKFGIKIPSTITGGQLLDQFLVSEIDFGSMVTEFLTTTIDGVVYRYIMVPLINVMICVGLLVFAYGMYSVVDKVPFSAVAMYAMQAVIVGMAFVFATKFGVLLSIFVGLMFIGSLIHCVSAFQETEYSDKLKNRFKNI